MNHPVAFSHLVVDTPRLQAECVPFVAAAAVPDTLELSEHLLFGIESSEEDLYSNLDLNTSPDAPVSDSTRAWIHETVQDLTHHNDDETAQVAAVAVAVTPTDGPITNTVIQSVADTLAAAFPAHNTLIRRARSTNDKATCLRRLRHQSIVLRPLPTTSSPSLPHAPRASLLKPTLLARPQPAPEACHDDIIVELTFRDAFAISDATPRFAAVLDALPNVLVAPAPRFFAAVKFVCDELATMFRAREQPTPPWRTFAALRSMWSPHTSSETSVSHPPSLPPVSPAGPTDPPFPYPCIPHHDDPVSGLSAAASWSKPMSQVIGFDAPEFGSLVEDEFAAEDPYQPSFATALAAAAGLHLDQAPYPAVANASQHWPAAVGELHDEDPQEATPRPRLALKKASVPAPQQAGEQHFAVGSGAAAAAGPAVQGKGTATAVQHPYDLVAALRMELPRAPAPQPCNLWEAKKVEVQPSEVWKVQQWQAQQRDDDGDDELAPTASKPVLLTRPLPAQDKLLPIWKVKLGGAAIPLGRKVVA